MDSLVAFNFEMVRPKVWGMVFAVCTRLHRRFSLMSCVFTMALRRLFDKIDVSKCSFKVLERKEKIIISLVKFPPPKYGDDSYVNYKRTLRPGP